MRTLRGRKFKPPAQGHTETGFEPGQTYIRACVLIYFWIGLGWDTLRLKEGRYPSRNS